MSLHLEDDLKDLTKDELLHLLAWTVGPEDVYKAIVRQTSIGHGECERCYNPIRKLEGFMIRNRK